MVFVTRWGGCNRGPGEQGRRHCDSGCWYGREHNSFRPSQAKEEKKRPLSLSLLDYCRLGLRSLVLESFDNLRETGLLLHWGLGNIILKFPGVFFCFRFTGLVECDGSKSVILNFRRVRGILTTVTVLIH
ncbi:hypothetical protein RHSIM_Rhsim06G0013800 [Rhododendron simsii]|uniref:Uncharacterized protein n=1 Tax=Rhododendron simsii TaxID=118357 RepID=A0A834LKA6_RHOSS|nr:hypothetical protein RHSIM_Rhsim06G0013800 [Rhododendron simsii]